uniref:Uncharacterized protein n=1 Tax=Knipowitschia caucasica TaxID=637954 RepID=A0AAV2K3H8_KNICA
MSHQPPQPRLAHSRGLSLEDRSVTPLKTSTPVHKSASSSSSQRDSRLRGQIPAAESPLPHWSSQCRAGVTPLPCASSSPPSSSSSPSSSPSYCPSSSPSSSLSSSS